MRFGGNKGGEIDLTPGDVAVLPAGTGHQCLWHSADLMVIGAYPRTGHYDLCRGSKAEHDKAVLSIPQVPLPDSDPVFGKQGRCCGCGTTELAKLHVSVRLDLVLGRRAFDLCQMRAIPRRISGASPRTSAAMRRRAAACSTTAAARRCAHDRVAEGAARLMLCDAAPNVRALLAGRFAGQPKIEVDAPEDIARCPRRGRPHRHAFGRAISQRRAARPALSLFRRLLKPEGLLVLGDVIPPKLSALADAMALLRFGSQEGFLTAAVAGLARTAFSNYARLRSTLGLTHYSEAAMIETLAEAGFKAERAAQNIGHNPARMTFLARPEWPRYRAPNTLRNNSREPFEPSINRSVRRLMRHLHQCGPDPSDWPTAAGRGSRRPCQQPERCSWWRPPRLRRW